MASEKKEDMTNHPAAEDRAGDSMSGVRFQRFSDMLSYVLTFLPNNDVSSDSQIVKEVQVTVGLDLMMI